MFQETLDSPIQREHRDDGDVEDPPNPLFLGFVAPEAPERMHGYNMKLSTTIISKNVHKRFPYK